MKTGFAKIDITPPNGTLMGGQLIAPESSGVESRLFATAMCIDDGDRKTVIVSCDVLMLPNSFVNQVMEEISSGDIAEVLICTTHTHSGPLTVEVFGEKANVSYMKELKRCIIEAIQTASADCTESELSYVHGELEGYAFNRRFIMNDGTVETHPLRKNPHIVKPEGPDSKDIKLICAKDPKGKILGGALVFACHATVMERNNTLISTDFPGKTVQFLENSTGGTFLYLQGACGNIGSVNPLDSSMIGVGKDWAEIMGKAIGSKAGELLKAASIESGEKVNVLTRTIKLPRREIAPELLRWAQKHRNKATFTPELSDYGYELYGEIASGKLALEDYFRTDCWADFYANEIKTLAKDYQSQPELPFTIKIITIGNTAIVSLPCELFIEWQNKIVASSPFENTCVVELSNGWNGYIPTKEAFLRPGGYETKNVTSTMLIPEAGDIMFAAIMDMLKILNKKRRKN